MALMAAVTAAWIGAHAAFTRRVGCSPIPLWYRLFLSAASPCSTPVRVFDAAIGDRAAYMLANGYAPLTGYLFFDIVRGWATSAARRVAMVIVALTTYLWVGAAADPTRGRAREFSTGRYISAGTPI